MTVTKSKYKFVNRKSLSTIHWKVNPVLAVNELVLGHRIPEIILIDLTSDAPLAERTYVPCPKCESHHKSSTWSGRYKTAFGNWFGLHCPTCGYTIPCVRNWTALLILIVTYPIWFWWVDHWKQSWMKNQTKRFSNLGLERSSWQMSWVKVGLLWGGFMAVIMNIVLPIALGCDYNLSIILVNLLVWFVAGLLFGYGMKWMMRKYV